MQLEQQVSNRELSIKLRDLGVKQDSYFWWHTPIREGFGYPVIRSSTNTYRDGTEPNCSAFTCSELGEMLPKYVGVPQRQYFDYRSEEKIELEKPLWYWSVGGDFTKYSSGLADTEADARAKMLVYLLENELITL